LTDVTRRINPWKQRRDPPARDRVVDEASLFYIAMTRASDAVVVTYAAADEQGRSLRPSPYLKDLCAAHRDLEIARVPDARRARDTWDILSPSDLRARLTHELRTRPALRCDESALRARWNELYAWARVRFDQDQAWRRALWALIEENKASLAPQSVETLYRETLKTSVSRLETYAACPFQHYARFTLDLRERETATLQPVDMGQVHHAVLEEFVRDMVARDTDWGAIDTDTAMGMLHESCERVASRLPDDARVSGARHAYMLRRSAAQLGRVLAAQRCSGAAGLARPRRAELAFGLPGPGALPALELLTPLGRRVLLRGYIDRVDLAETSDELLGVVVDYKRTRDKRLDLSRAYHGLSLQLIAYLLVLREFGQTLAGRPIRPIGGFFVGLRSQYKQVDGPDDDKGISKAARDAHLPRGLIRFEDIEALDPALSDAGRSEYYSIARTKGGTLSDVNRSDGSTGADFDAVLEHTKFRLGELADGVLKGEIAVRPYRMGKLSPCSWCAMGDVCRFEWGISSPRFLDARKRSEVFTRLAVDQSGT